MATTILKNALIINEGEIKEAEILIQDGFIEKIASNISKFNAIEIDVKGKYVLPGIIDDQVHFREPGLTHKANIFTESRAAVAGGVTSFMEMPNTNPPATSLELLEEKYTIASKTSLANYSFFMGTTNSNADLALKINPKEVCGIKIFMGSSTGDMLVEEPAALTKLFCESQCLIAIHSENDHLVKANLDIFKAKYGDHIPASAHAEIRNVEACFEMTTKAVAYATKCGTRLHILHISTEEELQFFTNSIPLRDKKITSEVCVHHLWFDSSNYENLGNLIKCNPAIKEERHKKALFDALLDDRLDIIATDHAPHTWDEKQQIYTKAPSGLPLVQHGLNVMLDFYQQGKISLEKIVDKMCHKPAELFRIEKRGYVREGYWADLSILDLDQKWQVEKSNIWYKCGWSPFEGKTFQGKVTHTFVSGHLAYHDGQFNEMKMGERLRFA
ncbi:MAG: dihydroorotase [Cytophagales bacterium]